MLDFLDLTFHGVAQNPTGLPEFFGIPVRGALGHRLKKLVCQVSHGDCGRCLLLSACPYPAVFEGVPPAGRTVMRKYPRIPQPFVLSVGTPRPQQPADVTFSVCLFGPACRYWSYVCHTVMEAGRFGLGRNRSLIEWNAVTSGDDGTPIWSRNDERWDTPSPSQICRNAALAKDPSQKLLWRFLTPTQITSETFQPEKLALKIVTAGKRRWDLIRHFYGNEVGESLGSRRVEADEFTIERCDLQPWAARRFSGRQKRRMTVQGQVGEVEISGPWGDVGDWLHAVPVIHLGKKTSFGFGRVEWEILT